MPSPRPTSRSLEPEDLPLIGGIIELSETIDRRIDDVVSLAESIIEQNPRTVATTSPNPLDADAASSHSIEVREPAAQEIYVAIIRGGAPEAVARLCVRPGIGARDTDLVALAVQEHWQGPGLDVPDLWLAFAESFAQPLAQPVTESVPESVGPVSP